MSDLGSTRGRWFLGIAISGVYAFSANCANAQIVPDGTLPNNSIVTPVGSTSLIEGGTQTGSNLFHSFQQFSVPTGGTAFFNNAVDLQNIISRVTGGSISNIDGLIRANGSANLFLLNPNGIIFGENASLNVGGSFVASTANAIQFGDQGFFSATNPNTPPLLTVNPSALLFNQIAAAPIQNNSVAPAGLDPSGFNAFGLRVPDNQSLLLVGGNISMNGGQLNAFGGRVELGGLAGTGTVGLNLSGKELSFPDAVTRADVSLSNRSGVDVTAENKGDIAINARSLDISGRSFLFAGIGQGLGIASSQAGDITLNTTETVNIVSSSLINSVNQNARGNGGNIRITTNSLSVANGAQLQVISSGIGNVGGVIIDARDTVSFSGSLTGVISAVLGTGKGQGGEIRINTGNLLVTNGAQMIATTLGQGNAGSVIIDSRDSVSFDGGDNFGFVSGIFNDVNETGVGRGGDIRIRAGSLSLTNGAELTSSTYGKGDAGNVIIDVRDTVSLSDLRITNGRKLSSGIFSNVQRGAEGNGGKIQITTGSLFVTNNAELDVGTFGRGDGGSVTIDARDTISFDKGNIFSNVEEGAIGQGGDIRISTGSISFTNSAEIQASTAGPGDAGDVIITARDTISFDGVGTTEFESGIFSSGIFSEVEEKGEGKGGDIRLNTGSLLLTNGAQLVTSTLGLGNAGNVIIDARDTVSLDGVSPDGGFNSTIFSGLSQTGEGQGGDIRITTGSFSLTNGARLNVSTSGQGDAGFVTINAFDVVFLDGVGTNGLSSGLFASTAGVRGQGGSITVDTDLFRVANGAVVNARTFNSGNARSVTINANTFEAANGGQVSTATFSSGQAGNITLNVRDRITISGNDFTYDNRLAQFGEEIVGNQGATSGLFANTGPGSTGNGGNIFIQPRTVSAPKTVTIQDGAKIAVDSQGSGRGGNIEIQAENLRLDNQALISAQTASNQGGDITLRLFDLLLLRRNSNISATAGTAQQGGDGGNITINAPSGFIVAVSDEDSNIIANAFSGSGGRVDITARGIFGIQPRLGETLLSDITASSQFGVNGEVTINTPIVDFNLGLVELPTSLVDASGLIASNCAAFDDTEGSTFVVTGRGGLPPSPDEPLSNDVVWSDTRLTAIRATQNRSESPVKPPLKPEAVAIVPATGWVSNNRGEVTLISHAPNATMGSTPATCLQK